MGDAPKQIGDVVGVDRMDELDRQKLDPRIKLQLLMAEAKVAFGADPRSGHGISVFGLPRVILQLMLDLKADGHLGILRLQTATVVGYDEQGADVVAFYENVPIKVRCCVVGDRLVAYPDDKAPKSKQIDRRKAAEIRLAAHSNQLDRLREDEPDPYQLIKPVSRRIIT